MHRSVRNVPTRSSRATFSTEDGVSKTLAKVMFSSIVSWPQVSSSNSF